MKLNTSRKSGFTLVEIMIVVAIIGLLAAIAIPNFVRARESAQAKSCINNLRQIDGAVDQLALENGMKSTDATTMDSDAATGLLPYLKTEPKCPVGSTSYAPPAVGSAAVCPNTIAAHAIP